MSFIPLPMDVDRPVLWLVALLGIVAVGVGWSEAQVSVVEIQVRDGGGDGSLTIRQTRSGNGSLGARRATVAGTDPDDRRVGWTISRPGWYRLRITGDDRECEYRISVQRTDDGVVGEAPPSPDEDCPGVGVRVREVRRPFWLVEGA